MYHVSENRSYANHWPLLLAVCFWATNLVVDPTHAQDRGQKPSASRVINGYVEDAESGERLPAATVSAFELGIGTITNQYGFFSLTVRIDSLKLAFSYLGYESVTHALALSADTTLYVRLSPRIFDLDEIEVTAQADPLADRLRMSTHTVSVEQIEAMPAFLGEVDIQKSLQLLPGVQSGAEGKSGLYVRGGGSDQNLVLLDGVPVYNADHMLGFLSSFNADAMKHVELIKGGFPARYGGRLSSVLNLTMKEGNMKKFSGEGSVGLISTRAMIEGPIVRNRGSYLISGRRTLMDLFLRPFLSKTNRTLYYFQDINFKANYIVSNRDRIYLSGWLGKDVIDSRGTYEETRMDESQSQWGNRLAVLRWNRVIGHRTFMNIIAGFTDYRVITNYDETDIDKEEKFKYVSKISNLNTHVSIEHRLSSKHYFHMGIENIVHHFNPSSYSDYIMEDGEVLIDTTATVLGPIRRAPEISFYIDDITTLPGDVDARLGLRWTNYWAQHTWYSSLEPRLIANRYIGKKLSAKFSYAMTRQYLHLLNLLNAGDALNDIWLPTTNRIRPQQAHQFAAGMEQNFLVLGETYTLSLEGYYKWMRRVIEYKDETQAFDSIVYEWSDLTEAGNGRSYGAEVFFSKKTGRLNGWIGYTWSQTSRIFESINHGQRFPYRYDRRHDLSFVAQYRLTKSKEISATWIYGSGYPAWLPIERYTLSLHGYERIFTHYGQKNSSRLPAYHRLDLAIHFHKTKSWGERTFTFGMYNAYSRNNPIAVYPFQESEDENNVVFRQLSIFPILPALSYQVRF